MCRWDDSKLQQLSAEFFRAFSRMEYALKAAGHLKQNRTSAEADWTLFADAIHENLLVNESEEFVQAKDFILREPPKKQVVRDGATEWRESVPDHQNETDLLLKYMCRIRNNLFHGGKFNGRWFDPERSGPLLEAGIVVLGVFRDASASVREAYFG